MVAAHPDDETIGAAGLLLRLPGAAVIHLTDGAPRDPRLRPAGPDDREAYARVRRAEALAALAVAGVPAGRAVALAAVDQEVADAVADLARALAALLRRWRPRLVVTHALEGGHPDHDAAAVAVRAARALLLRGGARAPAVVEMTSYHRAGGRLVTGAFLPGPPEAVRRLPPAHAEAKRAMLACHASQREVLAPFGPGAGVERFRRAAPLDPRRRPSAEPLHYEALGWTTFEAWRDRVAASAAPLELGEPPWA